jgi:hypothetical protein
VLLAIAVIGGLILLIAGGDDSDSDSGTGSTAEVSQLEDRFLDRTVVDPDRGISIRRPASWKVNTEHGVINIQSKDRCLAVRLSAPVAAGRAEALQKDSITVLRGQFKTVRVRPGSTAQVGGVPTRSSTIAVTDPEGNVARVLLSVGTGTENAYLTEVVVRDPSCQGDLQLAQLMLGTAAFTK